MITTESAIVELSKPKDSSINSSANNIGDGFGSGMGMM